MYLIINGLIYLELNQESKGVNCNLLPDYHKAKNIFQQTSSTITQLEGLSSSVMVSLDSNRCPGKGEVIITYDSLQTRDNIKEILGKDYFGIPYRLLNI